MSQPPPGVPGSSVPDAQPTPVGPPASASTLSGASQATPPSGPAFRQPSPSTTRHQTSPPPPPIAPVAQPDVAPRKPQWRAFDLPLSTTGDVPGHRVGQALGVVFGVATRPRDLAHHPDMGYFAVMARQDAVAALVEQARSMGADGVIGLGFDTSKLSEGVTEVTAYGTAVTLER